MNCTYCGTQNADADHRCGRCGRRLDFETFGGGGNPGFSREATARRLDERQAIPIDEVRQAVASGPRPRQKTLFSEPVLQFGDYAETGASPKNEKPRPPRQKRSRPRVSRKRMRMEEAGQQRLALDAPLPSLPAEMKSGVRSAKSSAQPVAPPQYRVAAALLDVCMVLAAFGLFVGLSSWLGGWETIRGLPKPVWGVVAVGIIGLYKALWWLGGNESPGMACCRLQLRSFTDQPVTRVQRAHRFLGTLLSIAAAGLGLLWIIGDEERLGWNDYLSKTFPTLREN
jgi:uncharacterized RDD family membrane protein YckC